MNTKTFIIKKKREGQGWKYSGEIYASNWHDAKKRFTDNVRNDLASDDCFIRIYDRVDFEAQKLSEKGLFEFKGSGYYRIDSCGTDMVLDSKNISTFSEDVYTFSINSVDHENN